jgi:hypothetical protein
MKLKKNSLFKKSDRMKAQPYLFNSIKIKKIINNITKWNNIKFFHTPKLRIKLTIKNINTLKNIFCKFCNDQNLWLEINKMIQIGIINFSAKAIYENLSSLDSNILSIFLLEICLIEMDLTIFNLTLQYNSIKDINYILKGKEQNSFKKLILPLHMEKALNKSNFLFHSKNTKKNYLKEKSMGLNFCRKTFYTRYKDKFLLGFCGSKSLSILLGEKIHSFLRSTFDTSLRKSFPQSIEEKPIYFLGYKFESKKIFNIKINESHKQNKSLLKRIQNLKKNFSDLFMEKLNSEINLFFTKNVICHKLMFKNSKRFEHKKIWISLFQFQAVRSTQLWILFNNTKKEFLLPYNYFNKIKFINFNTYKIYSFNIYIYKCKLIVGKLLNCLNPLMTKSITNLSMYNALNLMELKKNIIFSYCLLLEKKYTNRKNLPQHKTIKIKKNYNSKIQRLIIAAPINYIYHKLRDLGFIHRNKPRPISNIRYIFLSDTRIIKSIGFLTYSFIFWYQLCNNFLHLKIIIELLRQSCFLTLCRKHNKSKNWAYKIYTSELILVKGLFNNFSFFPNHVHSILKKKHKKTANYFLCLNEILFLSI